MMLDRQTDKQTDRQTGAQANRFCISIKLNSLTCIYTYKQLVDVIFRQTDRQTDRVERPYAAKFIDFWSKRFSVQLQKCNARVISKKVSSLSEAGA